MNITRENIDDLNAIVNVNIEKKDYSNKVDKILSDYRKTANIPGFRKGHVPMGMVKRQYGKAVLVDEVNKLLQDALTNYLVEEKLDVLGNPLPVEQDNFDWDTENYEFQFELGLAPQFDVDLKTKKAITHYQIEADEETINKQIQNIQKQYGKLIAKDTVEKGDMISATFTNEEHNINETASFETSRLKEKKGLKSFLGAKVGDTLELKAQDIFEDTHDLTTFLKVEHDAAHNLKDKLHIEIKEVNAQEPADLDQELFDKLFGKDVVKSVTELKTKLKEDAEQQFQQQSDQQLLNDVTEAIIEKNSFDLPAEFLQKWLRVTGEKELTEEEAKEEFEKSEKAIRYQLIEAKLINENNLQVTFDEVKDFAKDRVKAQMAQFGQMDPSDEDIENIAARVLSNQEETKRISEQLTSQKLLDFYKENAKLKAKKLNYEDFVKEVYK
ncbi:trigger factor [Gangjinia marincola]|uniref:Trigger factor n=1 Tax=Gangjinia marincola TaxID=578463 RepID=A0ABP3XTY9_9FLAO